MESLLQIFLGLNKLLRKPIRVGMGNLTWTLSRSIDTDYLDVGDCHIESVIETNCKLNVAIDVIHECFEPVKEPYARRDLIEDVIFSRGWEILIFIKYEQFFLCTFTIVLPFSL